MKQKRFYTAPEMEIEEVIVEGALLSASLTNGGSDDMNVGDGVIK